MGQPGSKMADSSMASGHQLMDTKDPEERKRLAEEVRRDMKKIYSIRSAVSSTVPQSVSGITGREFKRMLLRSGMPARECFDTPRILWMEKEQEFTPLEKKNLRRSTITEFMDELKALGKLTLILLLDDEELEFHKTFRQKPLDEYYESIDAVTVVRVPVPRSGKATVEQLAEVEAIFRKLLRSDSKLLIQCDDGSSRCGRFVKHLVTLF